MLNYIKRLKSKLKKGSATEVLNTMFECIAVQEVRKAMPQRAQRRIRRLKGSYGLWDGED